MKILLVVDNTCNLNVNDIRNIKSFDIKVISLYIGKNNQYIKSENISKTKFYEELNSADYIPKTSQPAVKDFTDIFEKEINNYEHIISLHLPEKVSGTVNSAKIAAKNYSDEKITVIDSNTSTYGLGFLIKDLDEKFDEFKNIKEIEKYIRNFYRNTDILCTVGNLKYLKMGGRIGKVQAFLGGILNLRPLISLQEGELVPIKKVRGQKGFNREVLNYISNKNSILKRIAIVHTGNIKIASEVKEYLINSGITAKEIIIDYIDIVIGMHLGPDSVAIVADY